jgi:low temperature requirement protein LtrA
MSRRGRCLICLYMAETAAAPHEVEDEVRVSSIELFFDLVFVFTITQLTALLVSKPTWTSLGQIVLMLLVIWWMYSGFAWLTNAVPPDRTSRRLPLLAGMVAFFVISLVIPTAFSGNGVVFAGAYLAVIAIHGALYTQSASWSPASVWSFVRMNLLGGLSILAGAIIGGGWEYVLWAPAVILNAITPALITEDPGWLKAPHFVERHGLVVMIALGESVVAVGIGASGLKISWELVTVAVLGLMLTAELWWTYFGRDPEEAERKLRGTRPDRRSFLAVIGAYYWAYILILLGIVCLAAALEHAIGHAFDSLSFARALALGGGTALFYGGDILFRACLGLQFRPWRALAMLLAVATIPIGIETSALAQLAVLVAALGACAFAEGEPAGRSTSSAVQTRLRPSDLAS